MSRVTSASRASKEATAKAAMMGNADPHALVEALANSQLAVETYQEILRVPI